jgi:PAS domain S-box-containing protein
MFGEPFDRAAFVDLEVRLNHPDQTGGTTILCQYDRYATPPEILHDVLRTHPLAVVGEHLHDNLYYEPIDVADDSGETEQRRVEWKLGRLETLTRRQHALVDLGRIALTGPAQLDLLLSAAALVAAELRLDSVEIVEIMPTGNEVRRLVGLGLPGASTGAVEQIEVNGPLAGSALRAGQPLIVSNWDTETRFEEPPHLHEAGVHSTASVLISIGFGEQIFGVLSVHTRQPRTFAEDEILFLQSVAVILAHAVAAARHEASFKTLVEHAPDAIARLDRTLRIVYANPTIERLTGTPVDALVGQPWSAIGVAESQVASCELVLRQALRSGREQTMELTVRGNRGDCYFEARAVPESGADGTPQSLLLIAHDISQQHAAEAARAELYRELIGQQGRMQELMGRLVEERETALKRLGYAEQAEHLSARERQILQFLATGQTNREIGENLSLSAGTVKNYVARILGKLDVADRTQAAVRAVELGLVSLDQ